jgi:ABC-2 type transport system permease protein
LNGADTASPSRLRLALDELAKVPAFARRDFLESWSYRAVFFSDIGSLVIQMVTFYFVGKMVNPAVLPEYGGERTSYVDFVTVGILISVILTVGLNRVSTALKTEQWKGTLEALMMTPTTLTTIQLGTVVYSLVYIPLRTGFFLLAVVIAFDVGIHWSGLLPTVVLMVFFIPFVWGLGLISAGTILTFRGANLGVGAAVTLMTLASGAYFPLHLLPDWIETAAEINPMAIAIEGMRQAILGGVGWGEIAGDLLLLVPFSAASLVIGILGFRLAMRRERRRGTLGLY